MKILVVIPNYGMPPETLKERERMLKSMTSMNTEFDVVCIDRGPETIEGYYDEVLAGPAVLDKLKGVEKLYDAVIIYCFSDPAVEAAREMLDIPVIGPGEASIYIAAMLGHKFSLITVLEELIPKEIKRVYEMGFGHRLASVRAVDIPVADLRKDLTKTVKKVVEAARKAVEEDGAQVIVLTCLGFAGLGCEVQKRLGVPVVDPAVAAVKIAELMVDMKVTYSRKFYLRPREKVRANR
ncbi:MAG: aspartate/glutamate racemase family protein [Candidatus Bathyarchaeia archaeon]